MAQKKHSAAMSAVLILIALAGITAGAKLLISRSGEQQDEDQTVQAENSKPTALPDSSAVSSASDAPQDTAAETTVTTPEKPQVTIVTVGGITYVNGILIANKTYSLPADYDPGVDSEAYDAFCELQEAAAKDGLGMTIVSGYRSYSTQEALYNKYVSRDGKAEADRYSARPGHSEHQTGLAFDINNASSSFTDTPEAKWLAENCWKYGFILRYPEGKEEITGYMYESWHIRYLGREWAKTIYDSGLTLEEYFGIPSAYAS